MFSFATILLSVTFCSASHLDEGKRGDLQPTSLAALGTKNFFNTWWDDYLEKDNHWWTALFVVDFVLGLVLVPFMIECSLSSYEVQKYRFSFVIVNFALALGIAIPCVVSKDDKLIAWFAVTGLCFAVVGVVGTIIQLFITGGNLYPKEVDADITLPQQS